jgi:hypothetical protein
LFQPFCQLSALIQTLFRPVSNVVLMIRLIQDTITSILTAQQMLERDLQLLGVTPGEWGWHKQHTNEEDFVAHFGPNPEVVAILWERLQTATCAEARIDPKKHRVKDFLTALHWLKKYPTNTE